MTYSVILKSFKNLTHALYWYLYVSGTFANNYFDKLTLPHLKFNNESDVNVPHTNVMINGGGLHITQV